MNASLAAIHGSAELPEKFVNRSRGRDVSRQPTDVRGLGEGAVETAPDENACFRPRPPLTVAQGSNGSR